VVVGDVVVVCISPLRTARRTIVEIAAWYDDRNDAKDAFRVNTTDPKITGETAPGIGLPIASLAAVRLA